MIPVDLLVRQKLLNMVGLALGEFSILQTLRPFEYTGRPTARIITIVGVLSAKIFLNKYFVFFLYAITTRKVIAY